MNKLCQICEKNLSSIDYKLDSEENPKIAICLKCFKRIKKHIEFSLIKDLSSLRRVFFRSKHIYYIKESLYKKILGKDIEIQKKISEILKTPLDNFKIIKNRRVDFFSMQKIFMLLKKENNVNELSNCALKNKKKNKIDKLNKLAQDCKHRIKKAKSAIEKRKFGFSVNGHGFQIYKDLDYFLEKIRKEEENLKEIQKKIDAIVFPVASNDLKG